MKIADLRCHVVCPIQDDLDGPRREVPGADRLTGAISEFAIAGNAFASRRLRGRIAAASLHVALLTPDGRTVWEGLGGLDVVQKVAPNHRSRGSSVEVSLRTDPFDEPEHLRQGIALAFERALEDAGRSW